MNYKHIAVIGSGISGLTTTYLLQRRYQVTLFEQDDYLGGHTNTVDIEHNGRVYPVNTGFIVFNDWTYPNFIRLMDHLGVASEDSDMSFSVRCDRSGLEYNGSNLNTLFCQRRNLVNLRFWRMIQDIMRFNKEATRHYLSGTLDNGITLQDYLNREGYGDAFRRYYIIPMGAAIWSAPEADMMAFPAAFFIRFFHHHGLLSVNNRPQWRVISGGSRSYVDVLKRKLTGAVHLQRGIRRVTRHEHGVRLTDHQGAEHDFDAVVFACHSDQALAMLAQPSVREHSILGAIPYQDNSVVLHTDTRLLPRNKNGWAAWNYRIPTHAGQPVTVTYNMNILQNFDSETTFCVSLNQDADIDPATILRRYRYSHPAFTLAGADAQNRFDEINGHQHTFYCGAYWFNGFHEDGVNSAIRVAESLNVHFDELVPACTAHSTRAL
ncbi:NAD(P)/FAD-dependent oxidoreductase [Ketobacter sp.]|uniref:NAD(P)/FAD-dependent oxidoreductase n=1 Tax=Ketobacter sp. TaxID=2083498 RepID=UPI000F1577BA|nr:FAD-dependent oxidoreductase [Ketobacter sp.]RLU01623.1 MAG: FAD-dependent oxidoreductase [Ketobacter sp.]